MLIFVYIAPVFFQKKYRKLKLNFCFSLYALFYRCCCVRYANYSTIPKSCVCGRANIADSTCWSHTYGQLPLYRYGCTFFSPIFVILIKFECLIWYAPRIRFIYICSTSHKSNSIFFVFLFREPLGCRRSFKRCTTFRVQENHTHCSL